MGCFSCPGSTSWSCIQVPGFTSELTVWLWLQLHIMLGLISLCQFYSSKKWWDSKEVQSKYSPGKMVKKALKKGKCVEKFCVHCLASPYCICYLLLNVYADPVFRISGALHWWRRKDYSRKKMVGVISFFQFMVLLIFFCIDLNKWMVGEGIFIVS